MTTKSELRNLLKARRRALPATERLRASLALARLVARTSWLAPGKRIGLYIAMPQELDTRALIRVALSRGCRIFVPRILATRGHRMAFVPLAGPQRRHALGMQEPRGREFFPVRFLDTLFLPCVGLDPRGARLGQGAGYYDRALAFRRARGHWRGPRLVGLAYSFQVVPHIPADTTDVFMDVLVTDKGIYETLVDEDRALDIRHR